MLNKLPIMIRLLFLIVSIFLSPLDCLAVSPAEKHILIMFPYTQDFPVHGAYIKGIKSRLQQEMEYKFNYSYEYLDMARFANDEDYLADTARYFQEKYRKQQPDLLIAGGVLQYFLNKYGSNIFPGVPVIMAVNNEGNPTTQKMAAQFTVINGIHDLGRNMELILQTRPLTKKIHIILGDSAEERQILGGLQQVIEKYAHQVDFIFVNDLSYYQMLNHIRNLDDNSAILFIRWVADVSGQRYIPAQVLQTICQESKVPVFGTSAHLLGSGFVGGYVSSYEILGQNIAETGLAILKGKTVSDIHGASIPVNEYAFDWRELKRWGIEEDKLPIGSRIEYKEYSVWELYKGYIISGIALFLLETVLVFGLLINRIRRRRAENELAQLNMSLEKRVLERTQELQDSNDQLKIAHELLEVLNRKLDLTSRVDSLTGLYNRRHIEEKILEEYDKYLRTGVEFAVVIADIDFFKRVNDMYGHDAGDYLLKSVSEDLRKLVRAYDTVARWGGEEFLLLLPGTNIESAVGMAERIRRAIEESEYSYGTGVLSVTLTLGVSVSGGNYSVGAIIKMADVALYQGKRAGRNCVQK